MAITFHTSDVDFVLREKNRLRNWIDAVVMRQGMHVGNLSFVFCSDHYLLGVNQRFLQHDTYTDIITFDYVEGNILSGDIMISIDRVRDNAKKYRVPFVHELHRVMIHGVWHLMGQGDKSEEERSAMRACEDRALSLWQEIG